MAVAKDVEIGAWIMFNREPYKVKRKDVITAGTHSHSKLKFTLQGLFAPGEKQNVYAHNDSVELAELEMKSGQIISVTGDKCQIMDSRTYEIDDVYIPQGTEVKEGGIAQYVSFRGKCTVTLVIK